VPDPFHYRCLVGIQARLQGLSPELQDIPDANIVLRWLPRFREQIANVAADPTPLVTISPPGLEEILGGLNETDDVGYPCVVAFWDKDPDLAANLSRNLLWRERSMKALIEQRLAGVTEIEKIDIRPGPIVDPKAWDQEYFFSAFTALCIARQPRG
jgi:hypothetical protein